MKKIYFTALIIFVIIAVGILLFCIWRHIQNSVVDKYGMVNETKVVSAYFDESGSMSGAYVRLSAELNEQENNVDVVIETRDWINNPEERTEYKADESLLDEVQRVVAESKLISAEKSPISKDIVLDGATISVRVYYDDRFNFAVYSNQVLTDEQAAAMHKIADIIRSEEYKINE